VHAVANDSVDFGETFVAGAAKSYAGGVTESGGTTAHPVTDTRARAAGIEGGTGTRLGGDMSRAPQLAGGVAWDCPFPEEADEVGLDSALVTLRVAVDRQGNVAGVDVVRDPGDGFGREARRCAMRKRWAPALDRAGNPITATGIVNVRFQRK
jgi:protein TonB